ncbi:MAG: ABC transporter permease [Spirochaetales bacterium]|nr:MAG: ABC transporter permease [Spirochaetales bacterium]
MFKTMKLFELLRTCLAILIALAIAMVVIFLVSDMPGEALKHFLIGPLDSLRHFGNVLEMMIPLVFTGLAISVMFSAAQFNLGAEGAFFFGAIAASFIAVNWNLPPVIHPAVAILWGGVIGSVFCGLPGLLKIRWGASELVSSLMFNYIAFFFGLYLINYFLRDVNAGAMVSFPLQKSAKLVRLIPKTKVHFGIIIAALMIVLSGLFIFRTRWGYRIRVIGQNISFAEYAGINTAFSIVLAQVAGGFIAGVGGAVEVLGIYRRFTWQLLPGYGWTGVIVAILARNNPLYVPVAAFFLAYLRIGADLMSRQTDVQNEFVAIVQGVIIILVAAESFLSKYRHKLVVKEAMA